MRYELNYLPIASKDMIEIAEYISKELKNPTAAEKIAEDLIEAGERICDFPYSNQLFIPIKPLHHEYRMLRVHNYLMLYWVDDATMTVTVARVIYARRDYEKLID